MLTIASSNHKHRLQKGSDMVGGFPYFRKGIQTHQCNLAVTERLYLASIQCRCIRNLRLRSTERMFFLHLLEISSALLPCLSLCCIGLLRRQQRKKLLMVSLGSLARYNRPLSLQGADTSSFGKGKN